jgi:hypothetical protein
MFITGVNDTGDKFIADVVDTGEQVIAGVVDINIHSRISPRIFEKTRKGPKGILMGPRTLTHEKT